MSNINENIPNQDTIAAIDEVKLLKNKPDIKKYSSFKEFVKEMKNRIDM